MFFVTKNKTADEQGTCDREEKVTYTTEEGKKRGRGRQRREEERTRQTLLEALHSGIRDKRLTREEEVKGRAKKIMIVVPHNILPASVLSIYIPLFLLQETP